MADSVSVEQVIAYRLSAHGLANRIGDNGIVAASARCGIQNSPPGSALLSLHARVRGVTATMVAAAVEDRTLLQTWAMRGAPYFIPTRDASVFTTGVLPVGDNALRHFVSGVQQLLDELGIPISDAVELCGVGICNVLGHGRRLPIKQLGIELAQQISVDLPTGQRTVWNSQGPHAPGQIIGESVVHFCVRILALRQIVCLAPRAGNAAPVVLTEDWLKRPPRKTDAHSARAELLRRYLHCYGPSTPAAFATWLGVRAGDVAPWWKQVADEVTRVEFRGAAWILTQDRDALRHSSAVKGIRLLPPHDPYTQLRDRDTVVAKADHHLVWKSSGDPGTILVDGTIVGTWRPRKRGRVLALVISTFGSFPDRHKKSLCAEAEHIARLRGASTVEIAFA